MKKSECLPVIDAKFKKLSIKTAKKYHQHYEMTKRKFLSDKEFQKLRSMVKDDMSRDAIVIKFYMYTGARAREGLPVQFQDLDYKTKSVYITANKGSKDRDIPLPRWFFSQLWRYAKKLCKNPADRIFPMNYIMLHRIWGKWKPSYSTKSIHTLRHTRAIRVFRSERDIKLVQILLGHRNIKNTMVYLDFVYSQDEMKRILNVKD